MMRIKKQVKWNPILDNLDGKRFVDAFMVSEDRVLLKLFLSDFFTEKELVQLIRRFAGVCWLSIGTPYRHILTVTGLSSAILARLSKKLVDKEGGFSKLMEKMKKTTKERYSDPRWK